MRALRDAEPGLAGVVLGVNQKHNNVILGDSYRTLWGEDALTDTLCGPPPLTFRLSVPSFYQVNPDQTEVLYGKAVELAGLTGAGDGAGSLLRHRHHRPGYGPAGKGRLGRGGGARGGGRRRRQRRPERHHQRPLPLAPTRGRPPAAWRRRGCGPT